MKTLSAFAAILLCLAVIPAVAQSTPFCNAGLRPDGFVDFSALPKAPNAPTSTPFTATLPVAGIAGLTVTLTIPATPSGATGPLYVAQGGTLSLIAGSPLVTLQFSSLVVGVSVLATAEGRGESFTLGPLASGTDPAQFANIAESFTEAPYVYTVPLQEVERSGGFTTTQISGGGQDFNYSTGVSVALSNLRVQSSAATVTNVPTQGLQQWLRSESVEGQLAGVAQEWPDQSGNGHNATAPITPGQFGPTQIQQDGNHCQGAFAFGNNSYFNFNLPINGWTQMTVFLVGKSLQDPPAGTYASLSSAILWNENASWGNTFLSPYQQSVPFRFGTTQVNNQPIYTRPVTVGQDFTVTRAVHNQTTDSLYVDGMLVLSQGNKNPALSGTTGAGYIGRGINNTYFNGEVSEILVYNRITTAAETAAIEGYLRNKFGTR